MTPSKYDYKEDLLARLKNHSYAQMYLEAAANESRATLLLALRDVVESQTSMSQIAINADVNRENLYRVLSEDGNPTLSTFEAILTELGMKFSIVQIDQPAPQAMPPQSVVPAMEEAGENISAGEANQNIATTTGGMNFNVVGSGQITSTGESLASSQWPFPDWAAQELVMQNTGDDYAE